MSSTGANGAAAPASGSAAAAPSSAPTPASPCALGSTAVAQPAYPGPLAIYQQNPYVLELSAINPDLTTDDARAIATFLRATCFARVDTLLYLTCDGQLEFLAAWSCSRNEEFRRRVGDASRPCSVIMSLSRYRHHFGGFPALRHRLAEPETSSGRPFPSRFVRSRRLVDLS